MKKSALIIVAMVVAVIFIGFGAIVQRLQYESKEAKERAIHWANKWDEQVNSSGGADDAWFEKNAMTRTGQPEDLLRLADEIGLKHIRKTNLAYVDPEEISVDTDGFAYAHYSSGTYGDPVSRKISIPKGAIERDGELRVKRTLAHEYLHYIWYNSSSIMSDEKLETGLLSMYGSNQWLNNRVRPYVEKGVLTRSELFSFACVDMPDNQLDRYVLEQCNKWIDRSKL